MESERRAPVVAETVMGIGDGLRGTSELGDGPRRTRELGDGLRSTSELGDGLTSTGELIVHLTTGVTARGTLFMRDGRAAQGALVTARSPSAGASQIAHASPDGEFVLEHIPPGEILLVASAHGFGESSSATFTARDGESLHWDATIEAEQVIQGSVIGPDDRKIAIWLVKAVPEDRDPNGQELSLGRWLEDKIFNDPAPDLLQCWTDSRGRFRVPCRGPGPHRLELRPRMGWTSAPHASLSGVQPGTSDVVVRYTPTGSWMCGKLALPDVAQSSACELIAIERADGNDAHFSSDPATGEFKLGPLPAGVYDIIAWPAGCLPQSLGRYELSRGAALDLGQWRLERGE